ncbi:retrotransposon protein, putative, ty1-copia subclass [Tanacetum coccineum]
MITELQKMYGKPPGVELQELVNMFHSCKQAEGQSVSDHVLLMKSYLDQLATLNYAFPDKVSISFILNSLSKKALREQAAKLLVLPLHTCDGDSKCVESRRNNASNKRTKPNLDSSYLWHCRLAHINKKRIEKLQHDGLLKPTDNEPFDQCVSCISGKMTRKPFSHKTEKVKDVLGLIHTDVCGPLRHVSKKGASYFITFTDDYSRYGYVYLLKHKHEVFETFKVFKNEVENQLGKTIKAIRSDRGGEYISQE